MTPATTEEEAKPIPVTIEAMGGALIDSARITVMAAMGLLPQKRIITAADDEGPNVHNCLEEAMMWLDAARAITIEQGAPVTSLHVVPR